MKSVSILIALALAAPALAADAPRMPGATVKARKAASIFGSCAVERSAAKAREVLVQDFTKPAYRNGMEVIGRSNEDCMRKTGHYRMRIGNLPMAAAMAEALLARNETPLKVRLARAAAGKVAPTYSASDAIAMCVARSMPDQVAALFDTEIGTDAEDEAVRALAPALRPCNPNGIKVEITSSGVRAVLATASFRLVAAQDS